MEATVIDSLVNSLAATLGLDGAAILAVLAVLSIVCRLVGKAIPDDATGWQAIVRRVCKVVGLYVSNRVTKGVTNSDITRASLSIPNVAKQARKRANSKNAVRRPESTTRLQ